MAIARTVADDGYHLDVRIFDLPDLNVSRRRHWRALVNEKQRWEKLVYWAVLEAGRPDKALPLARVVFTRGSAASGPPDYTNLVSSFKYIEDALVKCRVLADDKPENYVGGRAEYLWNPAPRSEGYVRIEIEG